MPWTSFYFYSPISHLILYTVRLQLGRELLPYMLYNIAQHLIILFYWLQQMVPQLLVRLAAPHLLQQLANRALVVVLLDVDQSLIYCISLMHLWSKNKISKPKTSRYNAMSLLSLRATRQVTKRKKYICNRSNLFITYHLYNEIF